MNNYDSVRDKIHVVKSISCTTSIPHGKVHDQCFIQGTLCSWRGKVIQVYGRSQQSLRGKLELRGGKSQVPHPLYETL